MILKHLLPPDEVQAVTRWRWLVVAFLCALLFNAAAGRGLILGGWLAYASEQEQLEGNAKIDRVLKLQIASTLRDLRQQECSANGNKAIITATIEDYQEDYKQLNGGVRYPLMPCETGERREHS